VNRSGSHRWIPVENQLPTAAEPIDGTDHDIEGQQQQQALEPPGVVHIEYPQGTEQLVTESPKGMQIGVRIVILGITVPMMDVSARESSRTMVSFTEQKNFQSGFAFFKNNSLLIGNYCIPPACNQIGNRCGKHMAGDADRCNTGCTEDSLSRNEGWWSISRRTKNFTTGIQRYYWDKILSATQTSGKITVSG
jgi:hypothetical protein